MPYQTPFLELVYPDESGRPSAIQYRIAFADTPDRLAIVHIRNTIQADQSPASSSIVRDQILNRILDDDLKGVPVNFVRLVVESNGASGMFAIEVDIDDYIARGNPFTSSHVATAGGTLRESISIQSQAVIAGSALVSTAHAAPEPVSPDIADALK
ncbi:hypothetical protein PQR46_32490 [Paraburkholderia sediminicola]|uniref:hypothetical protein n=1 Tax=Paraburkholderia TaxID=1822464 RepID=UPI0038BC3830